MPKLRKIIGCILWPLYNALDWAIFWGGELPLYTIEPARAWLARRKRYGQWTIAIRANDEAFRASQGVGRPPRGPIENVPSMTAFPTPPERPTVTTNLLKVGQFHASFSDLDSLPDPFLFSKKMTLRPNTSHEQQEKGREASP